MEEASTEPPLIVSEPFLIPVPDMEEASTEPPLIVSESLSIPVPDVEDAVTEPPLIVSRRLVLMAGYCSEYTVKLPLLFWELFIVGKEKGPIIKVGMSCLGFFVFRKLLFSKYILTLSTDCISSAGTKSATIFTLFR